MAAAFEESHVASWKGGSIDTGLRRFMDKLRRLVARHHLELLCIAHGMAGLWCSIVMAWGMIGVLGFWSAHASLTYMSFGVLIALLLLCDIGWYASIAGADAAARGGLIRLRFRQCFQLGVGVVVTLWFAALMPGMIGMTPADDGSGTLILPMLWATLPTDLFSLSVASMIAIAAMFGPMLAAWLLCRVRILRRVVAVVSGEFIAGIGLTLILTGFIAVVCELLGVWTSMAYVSFETDGIGRPRWRWLAATTAVLAMIILYGLVKSGRRIEAKNPSGVRALEILIASSLLLCIGSIAVESIRYEHLYFWVKGTYTGWFLGISVLLWSLRHYSLTTLVALHPDHEGEPCLSCGYDLRGTTSERCSECGAMAPRLNKDLEHGAK